MINFTSVYAPPEEDNPEFFLRAKEKINTTECDYGILPGDINSTLDFKYDIFGYTFFAYLLRMSKYNLRIRS